MQDLNPHDEICGKEAAGLTHPSKTSFGQQIHIRSWLPQDYKAPENLEKYVEWSADRVGIGQPTLFDERAFVFPTKALELKQKIRIRSVQMDYQLIK